MLWCDQPLGHGGFTHHFTRTSYDDGEEVTTGAQAWRSPDESFDLAKIGTKDDLSVYGRTDLERLVRSGEQVIEVKRAGVRAFAEEMRRRVASNLKTAMMHPDEQARRDSDARAAAYLVALQEAERLLW